MGSFFKDFMASNMHCDTKLIFKEMSLKLSTTPWWSTQTKDQQNTRVYITQARKLKAEDQESHNGEH